jgi:hypothetical protein
MTMNAEMGSRLDFLTSEVTHLRKSSATQLQMMEQMIDNLDMPANPDVLERLNSPAES